METLTSREISSMDGRISTGTRLLVVDDEALMRWSLSERLSGAGYEVHEAATGAAALDYFRADAPCVDVAVLDLGLPDTDGISMLKQIKRLCPACRVILMTAFGTPDTLVEAQRYGASTVILKPFDLDEMVRTVERALSTGAAVHEKIAASHDAYPPNH